MWPRDGIALPNYCWGRCGLPLFESWLSFTEAVCARRQRDYGPATDMWAVACIMGEIADGNPLLPGRDELDQLYVT